MRIAPPYRELELTRFGGLFTEADPRNLPSGASPQCWDVDFDISGVKTRAGLSNPITSYAPPLGTQGFSWIRRAFLEGFQYYVLAGDTAGNLYSQNINAPDIVSSFYSGILGGAQGISDSFYNREFICFSDLKTPLDQPRQWDGFHLDRISQVGPGAGPVPPSVKAVQYDVSSIVQPYPQKDIYSLIWGASMNDVNAPAAGNNLWLLGPITSPAAFIQGIKTGDIIYVSGLTNVSGSNPNGTYSVVGTGTWNGRYGLQYYIQVKTSVAVGNFAGTFSGPTLQRTAAVVQLSTPLPQQAAVAGNKISISGASPSGWNQSWDIQDTPSEGQLSISSTSLTSNIATYDYSLVSGNAPGWQSGFNYDFGAQIVDGYGHVWQVIDGRGASGSSEPAFPASPTTGETITDNLITWQYQTGVTMPVTVFNTSNANGLFNVQNATIASATNNSFTIALTHADVSAASESGSGISGSGSELVIDPGLVTLGSGNPGTDPIYGSDSTGTATYTASTSSGSVLAAGQRYAVVMFLTRSGYITPASPPVAFYTTGENAQLQFTGLPIGPANVIARIVAITLSNAGIGGPYYYISNDIVVPASSNTLGQTLTISSTIVNDNTSDSTPLMTLDDSYLAASIDVTASGNNHLTQRELGESVKVVNFSGRAFYLGEWAKIDQFVNLTFDGGSTVGAPNLPLGWTIDAGISGILSLTTSPIFGQALQLTAGSSTINPTGTALAGISSLHQTAYQTVFNTSIIQPQISYGARITIWASSLPSVLDNASFIVELYSAADGLSWQGIVDGSQLTTSPQTFTLSLDNPRWVTVPTDLQLRFYPNNFTGATVIVDRIELFPQNQPQYTNQLAASYADDYEAIDGSTGRIDISQWTADPIMNCFKFMNSLFICTWNRTFSVVDNGQEPAFWNIRELSNNVGCCGPLADDVGEEFVLVADGNGLYLFDGGSHISLTREIQSAWNSIYIPGLASIWIKNDIQSQRLLVGVPLPTPNANWLPNAPANAAPLTPNLILMCNYKLTSTGAQLAEAQPARPSMFTGQLLWRDEMRKWTIWQIPALCCERVFQAPNVYEIWLGSPSAAIMHLDPAATSDNGANINASYMSYDFSGAMDEEQKQLGAIRKQYPYASILIEGSGTWNLVGYPETPHTPYSVTLGPFTLANPALDDKNVPMNFVGNRLFLAIQAVNGSQFNLRRIVQAVMRHPRMGVSGR